MVYTPHLNGFVSLGRGMQIFFTNANLPYFLRCPFLCAFLCCHKVLIHGKIHFKTLFSQRASELRTSSRPAPPISARSPRTSWRSATSSMLPSWRSTRRAARLSQSPPSTSTSAWPRQESKSPPEMSPFIERKNCSKGLSGENLQGSKVGRGGGSKSLFNPVS